MICHPKLSSVSGFGLLWSKAKYRVIPFKSQKYKHTLGAGKRRWNKSLKPTDGHFVNLDMKSLRDKIWSNRYHNLKIWRNRDERESFIYESGFGSQDRSCIMFLLLMRLMMSWGEEQMKLLIPVGELGGKLIFKKQSQPVYRR